MKDWLTTRRPTWPKFSTFWLQVRHARLVRVAWEDSMLEEFIKDGAHQL